MQYKQPTTIHTIVEYIASSLGRKDISRVEIAANIVGATLANNMIDVEDLYREYPELNDIVEGACDLEILKDDNYYVSGLWKMLVVNVERLKKGWITISLLHETDKPLYRKSAARIVPLGETGYTRHSIS